MPGNGRKTDVIDFASGRGADGHGAMVARARALIPTLRERASRTEELRRLPPETERDLHEAGLFRIVQPKRVGGSELDYVALVDCADALGQADTSVSWNFANLASHHWLLEMFDQRSHRRADAGQCRQSERALCLAGVLAVSVCAVRSRPRQRAGLSRRLCRDRAASRLHL